MIEFHYAQFQQLLFLYAMPAARILAFVSVAPIWGTGGLPLRVRLFLGLTLSFFVAPIIAETKFVSLNAMLDVLSMQIFIGIAMGLSMRLVFGAIDVAGEYIGYQMGLGFATFYDPIDSSQTPVMSEFLTLMAILLFFAINGHYLYLEALIKSFHLLPLTPLSVLKTQSIWHIVHLASLMFSFGLLLALPIVATILMLNTTLAILTRAAPQLNIFALGFPITLLGGFFLLALGLSDMQAMMTVIFEKALESILSFIPRSTSNFFENF